MRPKITFLNMNEAKPGTCGVCQYANDHDLGLFALHCRVKRGETKVRSWHTCRRYKKYNPDYKKKVNI